jgi:hypothetical protein
MACRLSSSLRERVGSMSAAGSIQAGRIYRQGKPASAAETKSAPPSSADAGALNQHLPMRLTPEQLAVVLPALLTTEQLAKYVLNASVRAVHELLALDWAPRPIILGERSVRHSLAEWLAAISHMPRQVERCEPSQFARARALKSATTVSGVAS